MPIFDYRCESCGDTGEKYTMDGNLPPCECGGELSKLPSFPAMVLNRGNGLYPSEQKYIRGSAPFTSNYETKAWLEFDHTKYSMNGKMLDPTGQDTTMLAR